MVHLQPQLFLSKTTQQLQMQVGTAYDIISRELPTDYVDAMVQVAPSLRPVDLIRCWEETHEQRACNIVFGVWQTSCSCQHDAIILLQLVGTVPPVLCSAQTLTMQACTAGEAQHPVH